VIHCDIQGLYYDMGDMHTLTPQIREDIEFQKGINVKLNPEKVSHLKNELISSVRTLKTNTLWPPSFLYIFILVEQVIRNKFAFGSKV
jgi:hypothetical protein